jgi:hypothetical protein
MMASSFAMLNTVGNQSGSISFPLAEGDSKAKGSSRGVYVSEERERRPGAYIWETAG